MRNVISGIAIVTFTALTCATSAPAPQVPSDEDWLVQFREKAFDALMPIGEGLLVSYRGYHDGVIDVVERYFTIRFGEGVGFNRDNLQATVVAPIGASIQRQLLVLHMKDRAASLESVLSHIVVKRTTLVAHSCRAVKDRMDALERVRIQVGARDVMNVDPFSHHIVTDLGAGRIDATLHDNTEPLVRWAIQTHEALLACVRNVV